MGSVEETTSESPPSFEEAMARLEAIVRELEEGRIGLAEALDRYEQGMTLLRQCQAILASAEQRIELLTAVDAEGRAVTRPFEHTDSVTRQSSSVGKPAATQSAGNEAKPRGRRIAPAPPAPADEERPSLF